MLSERRVELERISRELIARETLMREEFFGLLKSVRSGEAGTAGGNASVGAGA